MSTLKLTADSGGGSVSLKGPASTTDNADVPFVLPVADGSAGQLLKTDGSKNLGWATDVGGKILSYQYAASSSTYTNTTSTTWVDSVITDSITTTKLNSKILVQANFRFWCNRSSGHNVVGTRVRRSEGTADEFIFMNNSQNWKFPSDIHSGMGSHIWVDSPTKAAGTALTYNIQARVHDTGGSQAWQIDSWHMVLMELDV